MRSTLYTYVLCILRTHFALLDFAGLHDFVDGKGKFRLSDSSVVVVVELIKLIANHARLAFLIQVGTIILKRIKVLSDS